MRFSRAGSVSIRSSSTRYSRTAETLVKYEPFACAEAAEKLIAVVVRSAVEPLGVSLIVDDSQVVHIRDPARAGRHAADTLIRRRGRSTTLTIPRPSRPGSRRSACLSQPSNAPLPYGRKNAWPVTRGRRRPATRRPPNRSSASTRATGSRSCTPRPLARRRQPTSRSVRMHGSLKACTTIWPIGRYCSGSATSAVAARTASLRCAPVSRGGFSPAVRAHGHTPTPETVARTECLGDTVRAIARGDRVYPRLALQPEERPVARNHDTAPLLNGTLYFGSVTLDGRRGASPGRESTPLCS